MSRYGIGNGNGVKIPGAHCNKTVCAKPLQLLLTDHLGDTDSGGGPVFYPTSWPSCNGTTLSVTKCLSACNNIWSHKPLPAALPSPTSEVKLFSANFLKVLAMDIFIANDQSVDSKEQICTSTWLTLPDLEDLYKVHWTLWQLIHRIWKYAAVNEAKLGFG